MTVDFGIIEKAIESLPEYRRSDGTFAEIGFPIPRKLHGKTVIAYFAYDLQEQVPEQVFLF